MDYSHNAGVAGKMSDWAGLTEVIDGVIGRSSGILRIQIRPSVVVDGSTRCYVRASQSMGDNKKGIVLPQRSGVQCFGEEREGRGFGQAGSEGRCVLLRMASG